MSDERKPMTDEELVAIKKRTDAITPGPWRVYYAHVPTDIARLLAEVRRLNKASRYLAEQMVHDGGAGLRWAGAFDEDCMRMYKTKEEAIQSWLDEANREVNNAE